MISFEDMRGFVLQCLKDVEEGIAEIPEELAAKPNDMVDHLINLNSYLASIGDNISYLRKTKDKNISTGLREAIEFSLGNFCGYTLRVLEKDDISSRDELFDYFEKSRYFSDIFDFAKNSYLVNLSFLNSHLDFGLRHYVNEKNQSEIKTEDRLVFLFFSGMEFLRRVMSDNLNELGVRPARGN